jgi:hypothetical protein
MFPKVAYYTGLVACIAIIVCCFIPWVHYNSINETFTGYHVKKFSTGNYYGRPGIVITVLGVAILICMLWQRLWAKRINLLLAALLFAYCVRTYILFTGALFEGEVVKLAGIYLVPVLAILVLIGAVFPRMGKEQV